MDGSMPRACLASRPCGFEHVGWATYSLRILGSEQRVDKYAPQLLAVNGKSSRLAVYRAPAMGCPLT